MQDDTIPAAKSLAHQASKISWVIGLISILLLAISRGTPVIVELTVPILILAGVACGVAALIGIRRHAVGGVRVPAIAGLVINGLLLSFFAYNLLFVGDGPHSQRAKQARAHAATQDITEEVREKLAHNIGISFLLFRTKVQAELKATQEQKEKLDQHLRTLLPEAMQVSQKSNGGRGKYNQKTHEKMAAVLKEILNEGQRTRLHQLELQKDLLFGPEWNMKELQITDAQRKQFMAPTQETQQKTQTLMEEIHKGANPDEIRPKALQLRLDLEAKLETLLTDAQKKQWKEMLGKPVDLSVIYGGVSSR
ncbi:MAG: hypothetical protein NT105_07910 [Verrucomicrobia bacterium]|nr:hypothetical protein [Verrucomicrobiota bacterium]